MYRWAVLQNYLRYFGNEKCLVRITSTYRYDLIMNFYFGNLLQHTFCSHKEAIQFYKLSHHFSISSLSFAGCCSNFHTSIEICIFIKSIPWQGAAELLNFFWLPKSKSKQLRKCISNQIISHAISDELFNHKFDDVAQLFRLLINEKRCLSRIGQNLYSEVFKTY